MKLSAFIQQAPVTLLAVLIVIFRTTDSGLAAPATPSGLKIVNPYYVSTTGSDSNPGTLDLPWRTIQKANSTMVSGDTVIVSPGTYAERITVASSNLTFIASGIVNMKGFVANSKNGTTIRGFYIESDGCSDGWGISIDGSNSLVENNTLYNNCRGGILFWDSTATAPTKSNNIARNNIISKSMVGIDVWGLNALIEGNEVFDGLQRHPKWLGNFPSWADTDGMHFHGSGHIFRNNYIHDFSFARPENVNPHIDCWQTWGGQTSNNLFENNRCIIPEQGPDGNAQTQNFMIEGSNSVITIRRNYLAAFRNINAWNSDSLTVVNNCFVSSLAYTDTSQSVLAYQSSTNSTFKNNVILNPKYHYIVNSGSGLSADYNSVYRSDGGTIPGPRSSHDLWGINPTVDTNCVPLAGSPLIDAGTNIGLPYQGVGPDIGAYEIK